jgi:hypothetical protein
VEWTGVELERIYKNKVEEEETKYIRVQHYRIGLIRKEYNTTDNKRA